MRTIMNKNIKFYEHCLQIAKKFLLCSKIEYEELQCEALETLLGILCEDVNEEDISVTLYDHYIVKNVILSKDEINDLSKWYSNLEGTLDEFFLYEHGLNSEMVLYAFGYILKKIESYSNIYFK